MFGGLSFVWLERYARSSTHTTAFQHSRIHALPHSFTPSLPSTLHAVICLEGTAPAIDAEKCGLFWKKSFRNDDKSQFSKLQNGY
jgi:hypothetical protein